MFSRGCNPRFSKCKVRLSQKPDFFCAIKQIIDTIFSFFVVHCSGATNYQPLHIILDMSDTSHSSLQKILLMPWRWRRRTWTAIFALVISLYILSPIPVIHSVARTESPGHVNWVSKTFYAPLMWCFAHSTTVQRLYLEEWRWIDRVAGPQKCGILFDQSSRQFFLSSQPYGGALIFHRIKTTGGAPPAKGQRALLP